MVRAFWHTVNCPARSPLAVLGSMVAAMDGSGVDESGVDGSVLEELVGELLVEELVIGSVALNCSMYATCSGVRFTVGADP